jgi:hypothetical protein
MAHERASERERTDLQKTKHAEEKKKGTGDGERASQQRRGKRLRKSVFQNGRESPLKWMCFGVPIQVCVRPRSSKLGTLFAFSSFCWPCLPRQEGYCCVLDSF